MRLNGTPKRLLALLLVMLTALSLCACSKTEEDPPAQEEVTTQQPETPPEEEQEEEPPAEPEPEEEPEPEVFVPDGNVNPLTGECDGISDAALTRKPVAVMVNNIKTALPQWGISQADIIYEMLAEGRITRFLAIFKDPSKIDKLASIRSARPYYIDIAQSYDAVYLHFGGSVPAYDAIAARKDLINLDGIRGGWEGSLYQRDAGRKKSMGYEHSVYATGESIEAALATLKQDLTQETQPSAFAFTNTIENVPASIAGGQDAAKVTVTFSSSHKPWFEYNAENGTWLRFQYGTAQMDAIAEKQIEVKNLLVLRMATRDVPGSELKLIEITTTGTGTGYYFCDGKYIPITWQKDTYNSEIHYFDESGAPLELARGKTFVSVVTESADVVIE